MPETIMPTWDQTLIIEDIEIYGDKKITVDTPPDVVIELYDRDIIVSIAGDCHGATD